MKIAPSVLSLDYADTKSQIELLNASEAEWYHFDVMDGHFVPNLTFGPDILKAFKKNTDCLMDVHIMVDDPDFISDIFLDAGADILTFHYEALEFDEDRIELANKIKEKGVLPGISIKPGTDVSYLEPLLPYFKVILIMSVEPGFGGQSFIPSALDKIQQLSKWKKEKNLDYEIEVDGGINYETAALCKKAGVDVLVAGSFIFKNDIIETVHGLKNV